MRTAWRRHRTDIAAVAALLGLALLFFWPVTFGLGFIPRGGGDLASFLWPTYSYGAHALSSGRVPLWNPTLYAGAPFAADPQTAAFYPLNLIAYLAAPAFPYIVLEGLVIAHVWLAGAGMYALLRVWLGTGSDRVAALAGAVALMFNDVFVIHVGNYNIIAAASWLPWALVALHLAWERPAARWRAAAAGALALSVLAGHAQLTLMTWGAVALYALWGVAAAWRAGHASRRAVAAGQVFAIALLLSAPAWLPALELQGYTARAELSYAQASDFALPWSGLAGLFSPLLLGRGSGDFWAPWPRVEAGYIGVATLVLAAYALWRRPNRLSLYLAVLGLGGLILALGPNTPLHRILYDAVGVFRGLRVPARYIFLTDFALAGLAGVGMQALVAGVRRGWRPGAVLVGMLGAAALFAGYTVAAPSRSPAPAPWLAVAVAAGLWALTLGLGWGGDRPWRRWALWALLAIDLIGHGAWVEIDFTDPTLGFQHPIAVAFLQDRSGPTRIDVATPAVAPDFGARHGFDDIGGIYNPLGLATMQTFRDSLGARGSDRYDFLGAQWILAGKDEPPAADPAIVPVYVDDPAIDIYLNNGALPRVSLRAVADVVEEGQALAKLMEPGYALNERVVIEPIAALSTGVAGPAVPPRWDASVGGGVGRLQIEAYDAERIRLRVTTSDPSWLVLADAWYPGWRATIDGAPAPIFRANLAFRAIALEAPGEHVVELVFLPATQVLGGVLAVIGLMAVAADWLWKRPGRDILRP